MARRVCHPTAIPSSEFVFQKANHFKSITFEHVPSDYALLKITELPEDQSGGDTLWASGYELYDRLSPTIQKLAEELKVVHHQVSKTTLLSRFSRHNI